MQIMTGIEYSSHIHISYLYYSVIVFKIRI